MIMLCDKSIIPAISLIYKNCINSGVFPNILKESNVVSVHKKGDKQVVENYRPASLLPVFGKILERLIFNSLFEFLHENNLLKGYLCYKTITSQNVSLEVLVKNFFVL